MRLSLRSSIGAAELLSLRPQLVHRRVDVIAHNRDRVLPRVIISLTFPHAVRWVRAGVRLRYSKICPWRKRQMLIVFAAAAKASRMASTGSSSRVLQFAQSTRRKPSIDQ